MQGDQNCKILLLYWTKFPHVLLLRLLCVIQLPWRTAIACCCSVVKSCLTLHDPMDCSMSGFPVPHHLQCSCLENPRDGGAWWAAIYWVAQSQTWLKWLSSSSTISLVQSLSRVRLLAVPWTGAYQAPPSMGFLREEYWSGLPFPSPGALPDPVD